VKEGTRKKADRLFSHRIESISSSGIRHFFELIANLDGVISLGVGEPDFVTPERYSRAAFESVESGETHYTSNYGLHPLREAIADHLQRLYGVRYDPQREIIVTIGVSEALLLASHVLLNPGDEVLCPDPYYVAYPPCVILAGGKMAPVPTEMERGFRVTAEEIEAKVTPRSKALLLGYPSNPTGAQMSREDLTDIADVAERHDLTVISDEIYDRLSYGMDHTCFASLPGMKERTVLLGGFSKSYAMTGWRVGWVCAPSDILEAMMKVHQYIVMSAPTPSQYAALEAIQNGEEDVRRFVAEFDRRRRLMVKGLGEIGLALSEPHGAFYVFPSIRSTGMDDVEFSERLLDEEKVAVIPGSAFGECGRGHVRMCYASPYNLLEEALERIGRFAARHSS
jgi:aminotransferase